MRKAKYILVVKLSTTQLSGLAINYKQPTPQSLIIIRFLSTIRVHDYKSHNIKGKKQLFLKYDYSIII